MKAIEVLESNERYELRKETSRFYFDVGVMNDPQGDAEQVAEELAQQSGQKVTVVVGYNPQNQRIGDEEITRYLCDKLGIAPELRTPDSNTCSIGFCEREQKWYGWSHRAIFGFGVGDVAKEGDCCTTSGLTDDYLAQHPELDVRVPVGFKAETLEDAKRMAIAFADSVG